MKYKLTITLYTMEEIVPYEYHRETPTGHSILYRSEIPLVLCKYESDSLYEIKEKAELIEKYGEVSYINVEIHTTKLDTFILEIPDVNTRVINELKKFDCEIKISTVSDNISFLLKSSHTIDTVIPKALFIVNTEIMRKEQLITRRGMIMVFDELIEPEWYALSISKIRSIVITERLKKPNNFKVERAVLGEIIISHQDSNRIAKYISKVTGKPIVQVGSTLLVRADYDDVQNSIKVSRGECANEITYVLTQRKYHIDPLLYLKCYRDIMDVDRQIESLV